MVVVSMPVVAALSLEAGVLMVVDEVSVVETAEVFLPLLQARNTTPDPRMKSDFTIIVFIVFLFLWIN
jgi:hypothetical protein